MDGNLNKVLSVGGTVLFCLVILLKGHGQKEPEKYSYSWIKKLSEQAWKAERNKVWQKWANPNQDDQTRSQLWSLLQLFDKVKENKDWAGKKPQGPSYHREHGYNLYKPD